MYTECRIQFIDDGSELDVLIKANEEIGSDDEDIFFYGLSKREIVAMCENGAILEGEWKIIEVYN